MKIDKFREHIKSTPHVCKRCKARFENDEILQHHRQNKHCEYKCNDSLRDLGKSNKPPICNPIPSELISNTLECGYVWNPWENKYWRYNSKVGIWEEDKSIFVRDENKNITIDINGRCCYPTIINKDSSFFKILFNTLEQMKFEKNSQIPCKPQIPSNPKIQPISIKKDIRIDYDSITNSKLPSKI